VNEDSDFEFRTTNLQKLVVDIVDIRDIKLYINRALDSIREISVDVDRKLVLPVMMKKECYNIFIFNHQFPVTFLFLCTSIIHLNTRFV